MSIYLFVLRLLYMYFIFDDVVSRRERRFVENFYTHRTAFNKYNCGMYFLYNFSLLFNVDNIS